MKLSISEPILLLLCIAFLSTKLVGAENILFYWGVSGYSHRISVWPLVERLVENGHNVTFFSPHPPKKPHPRVTEIIVDSFFEDMDWDLDLLKTRITQGPSGIRSIWSKYFDFAIDHCNVVFRKPEMVTWINNSSFDLLIINALFNDCAFGLSHLYKAPHIMYSTTSWLWSETYGYDDENFPEFQYHYPIDMNLLQRVNNALIPLYWHWNRNIYMFPKVEEALKTGLKLNDMPALSEIEKNVSLIFVNSHSSEDYPRSWPALVVEIGGMHCTEKINPLPKDIKEFVESEDEGFMYFSFGTFANTKSLPESIRNAIFGAMKRFKRVKFLLRWDGSPPSGLSSNVKAAQWVPQQDILAHPNIKGFISHGGLMGTQEAAFHGVPMIVLPLFADQDYNADRIHSRKRGIKLEISQLTQKQLEDAIEELLSNKIYMENSKKVSRNFKDRPSKPVEIALFWVELVLRNKDMSHLRPIGMNKNWYQRRKLDVWGFIALVFFILLILICLTVHYLNKYFSQGSNKSIHLIKKNK